MHGEVRKWWPNGLRSGFRLARGGLVGDHDVAERRGAFPSFPASGDKNVGNDNTLVGSSLPAPMAVERADRRIIGEHDSKLAVVVDTIAAAIAIARRSTALTPRCAFHSRRLDHDVDDGGSCLAGRHSFASRGRAVCTALS